MCGNGCYELFVENMTLPFAPSTSISYKTGVFSLSDDVCGIYLMILCTNYFDFVTLTFDLLTLATSDELSFIPPPHQCLVSYDYPFLSYGWLNVITLPLHETVTAHAPCNCDVTNHRRGDDSHFLKSLTPIFFFSRVSRVISENCVFYCEGYKVYCACTVSRYLCIMGSENHAWQCLTQNNLFTFQLLWGYDDD